MTSLQSLLVPLDQAAQLLMNGQVGVVPTDTVYGLAARALDQQAVARLYALKRRERKPGTLIAASVQQLQELGVEDTQLSKVAHLWPASLSVILPVGESVAYLHQGVGDIALRVVPDSPLQSLLEQTGPLLTSSANQPGEPGSTTVSEAWDYFKDSVDFYVDGGDLSGRSPSTIVRLTPTGKLEVIRHGVVKV